MIFGGQITVNISLLDPRGGFGLSINTDHDRAFSGTVICYRGKVDTVACSSGQYIVYLNTLMELKVTDFRNNFHRTLVGMEMEPKYLAVGGDIVIAASLHKIQAFSISSGDLVGEKV